MADFLHWTVSMSSSRDRHGVAYLDLRDERYGLIELPPSVSKKLFFGIGSLDEKFVVFYSSKEDSTSSIWILKEHRRAESWTRIKIAVDCVSSLEAFMYFQPLCMLEPGKILVRVGAKNIAIFDVEKRRCDDISSPDTAEFKMICYVESLVSPHPTLN